MKAKFFPRSLFIAGTMLLTISCVQAANLYWDDNSTTAGAGGTPTGTWGTDSNWNTDSTGANLGALQIGTLNIDDVFFSAGTDAVNAYTISLNSATQNARLVTFEDGTATLNNGTLSLGNLGGITVASSTVTGATISSNLTLNGSQSFNVAASRTLTLDTGTFTRNAGATLNVANTGTVTTTMTGLATGSLVNGIIGPWASHGSGASTRYATINGSNNIVGLTGTAAATAANVTSTLGTVNYDMAGGNAAFGAGANINTLRYTGGGATVTGNLTTKGIMNVGGGTLTLSGTMSGGGELVVNTANGNVQFNAVLTSGTTSLVKDGPGRLTTHNAATTFTGPVTVNGGVLQYGDQLGWLTTGNITLNGGVIEQRWNATNTLAQGSGAGQIQILGGESGFSENGATGLTWNIGAITWGSATFNPSKFVLQTSASQNGSSVTMAAASTFNLGGATRTILVNSGAVGNASGTIAGAISNGGLIKEGAGLLALSATNSYAAGTTISQGTLRFDTRLSMPATGTVTVADGAALGVTVAGSGTTWGSGTGAAGIAGLTSTTNSGQGFGGQAGTLVNFDGNSILNLNVTGNVTESNAIGNGTATSIRLIKSGGSTLTLTSGSNSYSGGTTLTAGALALGHNSALGGGTLALNGGTIQSDTGTARSFTNAVTIGGDFTVGGTGNLTFSNTGASALGATRTITVTTGSVNATFAQAFSGSGAGITKAGAGTLTLTGNNTFTGPTNVNAGAIVLNNGGNVTGSSVTFGGNNTSLTVTGGATTSTWNAGNGNFGTGSNTFSNVQVLIDGAGTAGSAVLTNVNLLIWGRTAINSTITLTNGGQMNVNGEVRIGNPYYSETGGANVTIGGGTATSTFTGNTGQDFYIGYGERTGSKNNVVTVSSGGVLTGIRDMFVGHVFDAQNNANPSTNNQLLVTGTGTASMRGISLGYANATSSRTANANIVSVTGGGTLTSTGAILIGRANLAGSQSNSNTMTVSGTGSTWNASNQNVTVGFTNNATATSNNNILTVGTGAVVSNIAALTLGSGAGTETGNELLLLGGGSLTATSITVSAGNTLRFGTGGTTSALSLTGDITNNGSMVFNLSDTITQGTNFDSAFGGSGSVSQNGSGDLILTGTNTYNGGTNINAGTLSFANGSLGTTGNITFAGNSSLRWHGSNIQNVSSRIVMSNGVTSSFHTNGNDVNFASAIGSSTSGSLTKAGAGKLTLNGVNSYTGATSVSAGTLEIASGGSTHASSGVSVTGTANLIVNGTVNGTVTTAAGTTLSGTGTIAGNATISGIHNPGNSPGIQTFGGNLTYEGGSSVVNWELTGNTTTNVANPNAVFDQMLITGELNFAATTSVNLVFNGAGSTVDWTNSLWNSSQSWLIYDVDTVNNFVNLDLNETNWLDSTGAFFDTVRPGGTFSFSQVSNGINLNYTVVPESSTALLGAFGALALLRRRRK